MCEVLRRGKNTHQPIIIEVFISPFSLFVCVNAKSMLFLRQVEGSKGVCVWRHVCVTTQAKRLAFLK